MPAFLDGDPSKIPARRSRRALLSLPVALLLGAGGCSVTPEKIEQWKGTEKGPGKLRDALRSDSLSVELRSQAMDALIEIGALPEVEEDLKEIPDAQKRDVIHAAVTPLIAMASGKAPDVGADTTRLQRNAKDGLFVVRDAAAPEDRAHIDDELIAWTTADLEGRMTAGTNSGERVLTAIGARAGARLVAVIGDPATSDLNRSTAARLLGKIGDRDTKDQGGAKLVERGKSESKLSDVTLAQLGTVGGDRVVAWLTQLAADGKQPAELRGKALMALSQAPDPAELGPALRLAGDAKAPAEVRDAAFEVLAKMGPPAVPGLAKLLDDKNDKMRWETVETLLLAGRVQAIAPTLEGLPTARAYPKNDLEDFVVRDLVKLGPSALPPLRDELKSQSWVARLGAAMTIAEIGKRDDAARLDALAGDTTKLKGWPGNPTLGAQARALAATLRAKHPRP